MLPAVHAAQVLLALLCLRLVVRKLRQLRPAQVAGASGGAGDEPSAAGQGADAAASLLAAFQRGDRAALAAPLYQLELVEAAVDALDGDGDVGAFVHTASLDARRRALAGARVIRGMATLASAVGLLAAMGHHFALIYGDFGPSPAAWAAAEQSATRGAIISMALGLGTAMSLYFASRVIRTRVIARMQEIVRFAEYVEDAAVYQQQWTEPAEQ